MDARAAAAIASCVSYIAKASTIITLIDLGVLKDQTWVGDEFISRENNVDLRDRSERSISQWFQQPMTFR